VDVDPDTPPYGDLEQSIQLADRVAVDRRRVEAADARRSLGRGLVQQLEYAGPTEYAILRERDDLHLHRIAKRRGGLAHVRDTAQADAEIHVDVGPPEPTRATRDLHNCAVSPTVHFWGIT
jgi:hypothetical protein